MKKKLDTSFVSLVCIFSFFPILFAIFLPVISIKKQSKTSHSEVTIQEKNNTPVNYRPTELIPNDEFFPHLWALGLPDKNSENTTNTTKLNANNTDIDAPEAWLSNINQSENMPQNDTLNEVVVAVLDTGIDYHHPDLLGRIWTNPREIVNDGIDNDNNGYIDDIHGIDTLNHNTNPLDINGHGTHIAGIIAASQNNGIGVCGVARRTKIIACKFMEKEGNTSGLVECLNYIVQLKKSGINIVATNNAWGATGYAQQVADAILEHDKAGILFVGASGNKGLNLDMEEYYPYSYQAWLPNIITVSSHNEQGDRSKFSNYGSNINISAPGENILSTINEGKYGTKNGTSQASAFVSGAIAFIAENYPTMPHNNIKQYLLDSSKVIYTNNNSLKALSLPKGYPSNIYYSEKLDTISSHPEEAHLQITSSNNKEEAELITPQKNGGSLSWIFYIAIAILRVTRFVVRFIPPSSRRLAWDNLRKP